MLVIVNYHCSFRFPLIVTGPMLAFKTV